MTKPVNRPHKKRGRPRKEIPAGAVRNIESLASRGFSVVGVAAGLGTNVHTLKKWFTENPELLQSFDRGREKERHALHNMLYRQAMKKGNATAAMFLLKARHGYREGDQAETSNRVSITFALPGALSMEDFTKVIQSGPGDDRDKRVPAARIALTRGS